MIDKKIKASWTSIHKAMTKRGIKLSFQINREYTLSKDEFTATPYDNFMALSIAIRDRVVERWISTQQRYHHDNLKRVYYISMEFLIGRLLENYIYNFGLEDEARKALEELGFDYEEVREQELDAGLGNGGLGRLAACFLDSMATLGIPAHGYGIRYDYGIFNQKIKDGYQLEYPDEWLKLGCPWEFARPEKAVRVKFYGRTEAVKDRNKKVKVKWIETDDVLAVPYDTPVLGYKNDVVNTLRLWSARSTEEFDLDYFQDGDYDKAVYKKIFSENISKVLYPNDNQIQGKELRLKQEYFLTASTVSDIIRRFLSENEDLKQLPEKAAIQLNDTHPALTVVELMRILVDEHEFEWDAAWEITSKTCNYTNHTLMPEALETWPVDLFQKVLPRHLQIIYEINNRFLKYVDKELGDENGRIERMSLISPEPEHVRMANLSIVGSSSVNGVSKLHSQLVKDYLFKDFYELTPEKFNNKTNGITQRQWLLKSNPKLAQFLKQTIGEGWITDLEQLTKLHSFKDDASVKQAWQSIKQENKFYLASYLEKTAGIVLNTESMFDVQVKRMHEYKRQLLFALYVISQYLTIKNDPSKFIYPRTFMIGGKAAPGYDMAKLIIKFINSIADVINTDPQVKGKIQLVFLENYRVSLAEKVFPASNLSEQISTAGTEASGTGNMKFMLNGALTIGTYDGANIEIAEQAGMDNIFIFGLKTHEVNEIKSKGYDPHKYIKQSPMLSEIYRLIKENFFCPHQPGLFYPIIEGSFDYDPYLVCADFDAYCARQDDVSNEYLNQDVWTKKSIINVAQSGMFSSDRTIAEYAKDIWNVPITNKTYKSSLSSVGADDETINHLQRSNFEDGRHRINFELKAPEAHNVFLVGDFTYWNQAPKPMHKMQDGRWRTYVNLDAGRYEYKFIVDDTWLLDPGNPNTSRNEFGDMNSVKEVVS